MKNFFFSFMNFMTSLIFCLMTIFDYYQSELIIRQLRHNNSNSENLNTSNLSIKMNNIKRVLISDIIFKRDTDSVSIPPSANNKIDGFLRFYKTFKYLFILNLSVFLLITTNYFYLVINKFMLDFFNFINVFQDGKNFLL